VVKQPSGRRRKSSNNILSVFPTLLALRRFSSKSSLLLVLVSDVHTLNEMEGGIHVIWWMCSTCFILGICGAFAVYFVALFLQRRYRCNVPVQAEEISNNRSAMIVPVPPLPYSTIRSNTSSIKPYQSRDLLLLFSADPTSTCTRATSNSTTSPTTTATNTACCQ
jgi:hypothetical protein